MNKEHDISAGVVRLDFDLLLQGANIAVGATKHHVERYLHDLQDASLRNDISQMRYTSRYLAQAAEQLAVCAENLHALEESKTRADLSIVKRNIIPLEEPDAAPIPFVEHFAARVRAA